MQKKKTTAKEQKKKKKKKKEGRSIHLLHAEWQKVKRAAGDGILIPQYSFHSDNKNRKIYTVAPQNRESSTYKF